MQIAVRELGVKDLSRIGEVDRTETIVARHVAKPSADGLGLTLTREIGDPPGHNPPWDEDAVKSRISLWRPELEQGGAFIGVFDGEKFAGFAIVGHKFPDNSAELCAVFVDAAYRREGIGTLLVREVEGLALQQGIKTLFVHANWTDSAVSFYLKRGYHILALCDSSAVRHKKADPEFFKVLDGKEHDQ